MLAQGFSKRCLGFNSVRACHHLVCSPEPLFALPLPLYQQEAPQLQLLWPIHANSTKSPALMADPEPLMADPQVRESHDDATGLPTDEPGRSCKDALPMSRDL